MKNISRFFPCIPCFSNNTPRASDNPDSASLPLSRIEPSNRPPSKRISTYAALKSHRGFNLSQWISTRGKSDPSVKEGHDVQHENRNTAGVLTANASDSMRADLEQTEEELRGKFSDGQSLQAAKHLHNVITTRYPQAATINLLSLNSDNGKLEAILVEFLHKQGIQVENLIVIDPMYSGSLPSFVQNLKEKGLLISTKRTKVLCDRFLSVSIQRHRRTHEPHRIFAATA